MLRAGLVLSALVVAVWLVAVVWIASTEADDLTAPLGVAVYTALSGWALAIVWLAVGVWYFVKPRR